MNCNECQNLLAEFAIDMLEPNERQQVASHLSNGCDPCQLQLQEYTDTWAAVPDRLTSVQPPDSIKQELLSRVRAEGTHQPNSPPVVLSPEPEPILLAPQRKAKANTKSWWALMPFIAASLVGVVTGYWMVGGETPDVDPVQKYQSHVSEAQRLFGTDRVFLASLQNPKQQSTMRGHVVWDGAVDQLHCYAFDLGELAQKSAFRLWFVSAQDEWQPVGDLEVQPRGVCTAVLQRPPLSKTWSRVVITMEPEGAATSSSKPQGPVRLRGDSLRPGL